MTTTTSLKLTTDIIFEDAEASLKCALNIRKHYTKIVNENPASNYSYNLNELDTIIHDLQQYIVSRAIAA